MKLRTVGLLVLTASVFMITACGQKGPLYIHKEEAPAAAPAEGIEGAEGVEAPAAEKAVKEEIKDETSNTGK
jgi:predicted small lipoprotein YifL